MLNSTIQNPSIGVATTAGTYPNNGPYYTTGTSPWTVVGTPNNYGAIAAGQNLSQSAKIKLDGADADIIINGQSLARAIQNINERLAILTPDPALEEEFEELKQLAIAYAECEKRMLEKKRVFDILKNTAL